jgi:alpha-L-fucosidase
MSTFRAALCLSLLAASTSAAEPIGSPEFIDSLPMQAGPFKPSWESMAAQYQVPEWFRDAKLGIFMHWGPCSVPARHGWYGLAMCDPDGSQDVFSHHRKTYGHQSVFGYKDLIPLWKAEKWDPDALVRRYKAAGARYIMPVGVHHDNFDNYNSAYQPWNSVNIGPKRDVVGEWRKAALNIGLHFTVSTHQHESWDWFHRSCNYDKTGDQAGVPWDAWQAKADGKGKWWEGYTPEDLYVHHFLPWDNLDVIHHKMVRTGRGDWPNERDILDAKDSVIGTVKVDPDAQAHFIRNWYLRTKDLIEKYHPEILCFDWGCPFSHLPCKDACYLRLQAHYYNSSLQWNRGKMLVGANLKHIKHWPIEWLTGSHDQIRRSCIEDFEGGRTGDRPALDPWQQCDSVNGEWFDDTHNPNRSLKRPVDIIRRLVSIVARNGNLLLNIAIKADGTICPDNAVVLDALTEFMSVNAELKDIEVGNQVIFDGRCEGATIKTSTVDFPEIRGYIIRLRHAR